MDYLKTSINGTNYKNLCFTFAHLSLELYIIDFLDKVKFEYGSPTTAKQQLLHVCLSVFKTRKEKFVHSLQWVSIDRVIKITEWFYNYLIVSGSYYD